MKPMQTRLARTEYVGWLILAANLALSLGCASLDAQTPLMKEAGATEISASELRTMVRALAGPISGLIEEAADHVLAQTDRPEIRKRALRWKIHSIPAMQTALFQPDPLGALIDAWVLTVQLGHSLEEVRKGYAGPEVAIAGDALDKILGELRTLATVALGDDDIEAVRGQVEAWALEHPILDTTAARFPTSAELARFTASSRVSLFDSMSVLTETRDDFAARADLYAAYLPKQARWQAEFFVSSLLSSEELRSAVPELAAATAALERVTNTVESLPGLVASERKAVLAAVTRERMAAMEALQRELARTLAFAAEERRTIFETHIAAERQVVLDTISAERTAAIEALHQERIETVAEIESLAGELVDRVFLRLVQVLALLLVIAGLPAFWLLYRLS